MPKPLALTSGEPAGIGPDVTLKAWLRRDELKLPTFYWLGDAASLDRRSKALGLNVTLAEGRPEDANDAFARALPVVSTGHAATALPGRPDDSSAGAALASIRQAVKDVMDGRASAGDHSIITGCGVAFFVAASSARYSVCPGCLKPAR